MIGYTLSALPLDPDDDARIYGYLNFSFHFKTIFQPILQRIFQPILKRT
jgi:hypothetical protein